MVFRPLVVTTGLDPVVHADWPTAIWSNECSSPLAPPSPRVRGEEDMRLSVLAMPSHPSFAHAKKSQAKECRQKILPSKRKKGGGAPISASTGKPHREAMRRASVLRSSNYGRTRPGLMSPEPHGAGALAFRRPTAAFRRGHPRFGLRPRFLESPDASGRTLSGTSAASTSRSGTRRTGRCPSRPCASVYRRNAREPPPLRLKEYPRDKASFASGMVGI
jgi:hypothetical protein